MSIATDEAAQKYPEPTDADDPMYKYLEAIEGHPAAKRQGYVAGRTAEPTEAEIEAASNVIALKIGNRILSRKLIKDALEAARKVVSE